MTDESGGSPLPQRERGATEAGARPAPAHVGVPALPDDLRQRMKASVDAERAQNRERAAEMLRHPPQRFVGAERPERPGDVPDREPSARRKRRAKADRALQPEAPATSGPDNKAPIVKNGTPVNSAPAESVSRATPHSAAARTADPIGLASNTDHTSNTSHSRPASPSSLGSPPPTAGPPAAGGVGLVTPPAGSPSAPVSVPAPGPALPPGHPSGPSVTASDPPATHAPRYASTPEVTPSGRRSRRRLKGGLAAGVLAVVACGAVGAIVATSGGKAPRVVQVSPARQGTVASWVTGQVDPATVVSCDPAMCAALVAHHYPSKNVHALGSPSALKASSVVVVTPVAVQLFGSSLVTAWAPAALATFGSGSSTVSVRIVAPDGATAYERAAREDQAVRASSEASLTGAKSSITVTGAAARELDSGQVDGRLFEALAAAASVQPIDIVDFGNAGSGASAGVPLRYADLAASNAAVGLSAPAYLQMLRISMGRSPGPRPARTQFLTLRGGQQVVRVEYLAPSQFGVLNP
jgi:hypothetical protein